MKSYLEKNLTEICVKHVGQKDIKVSLQKKSYGDYSCDIAFKLLKNGENALDVAHSIAKSLQAVEGVEKLEVQAPGFINIFVKPKFFYQKITEKIKSSWLKKVDLEIFENEWENIFYAYLRLKIILEHLKPSTDFEFDESFELQEQIILHCLDDLLSDLFFTAYSTFFVKLSIFANLIHGYLNTITLLCNNEKRYESQVQIISLCTIFLEKTFKVFGVSCPESI
jgi:arginyl-tRNA synthetase